VFNSYYDATAGSLVQKLVIFFVPIHEKMEGLSWKAVDTWSHLTASNIYVA
jgi:hypothetical protein